MAEPLFRVKMTGFAEMEKLLRELPKAVAKNVLRTAMKDAGQQVVDAAKAIVPKKSRGLEQSITMSVRLSRGQRRRRRKKGDVELFLGPSHPKGAHGHLIEFGHLDKDGNHVAKQPFLRPAWDDRKDQVLKDFSAAMWTAIQKALDKLHTQEWGVFSSMRRRGLL